MTTATATVAPTTRKARNKGVKTADFVLAWQDMELVMENGSPKLDAEGKPMTQKMNKVNTLEDFCKLTGMHQDSANSRASQIRTRNNIPLRSLPQTQKVSVTTNTDFLKGLCGTPANN